MTRGHERGQQTTAGHHCHLCPLRLRRWTVSHTVRGAGGHVPRDADAGFSPEEHECHCLSCRPPTKVSLVPLRGVHGWRHCWCGSAACTEVSAGGTDTRRPFPCPHRVLHVPPPSIPSPRRPCPRHPLTARQVLVRETAEAQGQSEGLRRHLEQRESSQGGDRGAGGGRWGRDPDVRGHIPKRPGADPPPRSGRASGGAGRALAAEAR